MTDLSRHILEQIASLTSDAVAVVAAGGAIYRVVYVNPAHETLTGYTDAETVGRPWRIFEAAADEPAEITNLRAAMAQGDPCALTLPDVRKDGTAWLSHLEAHPVQSKAGDLRHYLIIQRQLMASAGGESGLQVGLLQRELRRARQKAASLDRIDSASGVFRYEYFLEVADRDCRMARREQRLVAIVLFEVNDLDIYRETFGSKAADSCLRMIAAQVTRSLRRTGDLCGCDDSGRIIALVHGQDSEQVADLVSAISADIRRLGLHNPRGRSGRYITVRAGVAAGTPSSNRYLEDLIGQARVQLAPEPPTVRRTAQA